VNNEVLGYFWQKLVGIETRDLGIFVFHESNGRTWDNKMGVVEGRGRI
jgi:hypothetical protein